MASCCWTKDDIQCGSEAGIHYCIPLCNEHLSVFYSSRTKTIRQTATYHGAEIFPGYCYVVLLPDETVKIGYSNTKDTLKKRFQDLRRQFEREYGPGFTVLAVLRGGVAMEAVLHHRFRASRIPGPGERFVFSEDIQDYLATAPRVDFALAP